MIEILSLATIISAEIQVVRRIRGVLNPSQKNQKSTVF